jgi:hypothetical protein
MDYNKLIELIKELSGSSDVILGDSRIDKDTIYLELKLVEPQEVEPLIPEN